MNLRTILLLCAALCLPAVDYEAGMATLGREVAAALSVRTRSDGLLAGLCLALGPLLA